MERKTKNRILGIVVMAALVIALLPLFHGSNNEPKPDPQATSAPPFPDQSTQVSENAEFKMALANQTTPIPFKNNESESVFNQQPDDTINTNTSKAYNNPDKPVSAEKVAPKPAQPTVKQPNLSDDDGDDFEAPLSTDADKVLNNKVPHEATAESKPDAPQSTESIFRNSLETELQEATKPITKRVSHPVKSNDSFTTKIIKQVQRKVHAPLDNNGLFKLKNSAWVIQLGSYKNKANALKLVNRLRANGYSAFIQQASAGTSVYVGPETKEDIARSLAARLEYEMKIQGFVISYKPLTL